MADAAPLSQAGVLSKQFHPSRSTCNAYVVFAARDMAEEALALNNHLLDGRHLHVDLADSTVPTHTLVDAT